MTGPKMRSGSLSGQLCHCTACSHTFGGERGFNLHRCGEYAKPGQWQGTRRCMTPAEIEATGLVQDDAGVWRLPKPARFDAANGISGPRVTLRATGVAGAMP
jgi:hypothetical protein